MMYGHDLPITYSFYALYLQNTQIKHALLYAYLSASELLHFD